MVNFSVRSESSYRASRLPGPFRAEIRTPSHFRFAIGDRQYVADVGTPHDISLPIKKSGSHVRAFHIPRARFEPFRAGPFVGSVKEKGSCNCEGITLFAHGNGTHTECLGHLTAGRVYATVSLERFLKPLKRPFLVAHLVTVHPGILKNKDQVITAQHLRDALSGRFVPEALVIRTLPNDDSKKGRDYSGTNPPYLLPEALKYLARIGVFHVLVDLPSVDREDDGGRLASHRAFWGVKSGSFSPDPCRRYATITELIYVPNRIRDGTYALSLQIANIHSDAAPSKPLLYPIHG